MPQSPASVASFPPEDNTGSSVLVRLSDFGTCRANAAGEGCRGYAGTAAYMAPEILEYNGEQTYGSEVDMYSLGMLLYEMITLKQPFSNRPTIKNHVATHVIQGVRPSLYVEVSVGF